VDDDDTPLAQSAIALHELFLAWRKAGFTQAEALYIAAAVASGGIKVPEVDDE
jgi:hypothetical protein